ncbi:MAG: hypothetical protein EOP49_28465, partial [Sphingobacteriales bacterium]
NIAGHSTTQLSVTVTLASPIISQITPATALPGQTITISGSGFANASAVTIGGVQAASYLVVSPQLITAVIGAGASGTVSITTPGGTGSKTGFTIGAVPAISYTTPLIFNQDQAITTVLPVNTGGAIPAVVPGASTTITGSTNGYLDGAAVTALMNRPYGVTSDGGENLFVADYLNHRIRKVVIATGEITTLAGSGTPGYGDGTGTASGVRFNYPAGILYDGAGSLYVTDQLNHRVRKIVIATGVVTSIAGNGTDNSTDGAAGSGSFSNPMGITTDKAGNLYIADFNNSKIRKVVIATSAISTIAGTGAFGYADATGISATFNYPAGITFDSGNLYITDQLNNRIRKMNVSTGAVSTFAGNGTASSADGIGVTSGFNSPAGISADGLGNLYVADQGNNKIRKINIASGAVSTVAGSSTSGNADGTGAVAAFNGPTGVFSDQSGNIFIADQGNSRIRKIATTGYTISAPLPAGLVFDAATGAISGTPTTLTATTPYTINGTNTLGSVNAQLVMSVVPAGPVVASFAPLTTYAGQVVTITGTDLTGATAVSFGGVNAASFNVVSNTSITAIVAAGATGIVSVTTPSG